MCNLLKQHSYRLLKPSEMYTSEKQDVASERQLQPTKHSQGGWGGYSPKEMLFIVTNKCYGIENAAIVSHVRKYARVMQFLRVNRGMKNDR